MTNAFCAPVGLARAPILAFLLCVGIALALRPCRKVREGQCFDAKDADQATRRQINTHRVHVSCATQTHTKWQRLSMPPTWNAPAQPTLDVPYWSVLILRFNDGVETP